MTWGVVNLTARFGEAVVLSGITMTILPGRVQAIIGGDGAGKSTLLRILAGVGPASTGAASLPDRARIGYVPSDGGVFGDLTVKENLQFVADVHRLRTWHDRADVLVRHVALDRSGDVLARQLSGGQRRKLAGAMALLPEPTMLVLDEVTTGIDPVSRMELWRLVAGAAAHGAAVVVATTYLDEAERCASVHLLHQGRVLASGSPEEIVDGMAGSIERCDSPSDRARAWRVAAGWRQWHPDRVVEGAVPPTLEDASIVAELVARGAER